MLTDKIKNELMNMVEQTEVDVEELDSYSYDGNPYGLEYPLNRGSGCGDWDEDEEMVAKIQWVIDCIQEDGIGEWVSIGDEEDENGELTAEAIEYLMKEAEKYE